MGKDNKDTDIPGLFKIKKPKVDGQQIKDSWNSILKRINNGPKKGSTGH
ncbi:hypothetical protein [Mucilaginibacter sp.]